MTAGAVVIASLVYGAGQLGAAADDTVAELAGATLTLLLVIYAALVFAECALR